MVEKDSHKFANLSWHARLQMCPGTSIEVEKTPARKRPESGNQSSRPKQSLGQVIKSGIRDAFNDLFKPLPIPTPSPTPKPVESRKSGLTSKIASQADWNSFWEAFRAAVQKRDRKTLVALMANPFEAVSAGLYTPNQWIKEIDQSGGWRGMDASIKTGVRPTGLRKGRPSKISNNNYLIFVFGKDGKWRWAAVGGD
jgi:hypothetical protein